MKRGIHPRLQWVSLVTPHGRLIRVLMGKCIKSDLKPFFIRDPGKESEVIGQLAKFKKRFQFPTPKE